MKVDCIIIILQSKRILDNRSFCAAANRGWDDYEYTHEIVRAEYKQFSCFLSYIVDGLSGIFCWWTWYILVSKPLFNQTIDWKWFWNDQTEISGEKLQNIDIHLKIGVFNIFDIVNRVSFFVKIWKTAAKILKIA